MKLGCLRFVTESGGMSVLETALLLPMLVLMLMGAVDFGRGYYAAIEVASSAEAGALYGIQNSSDTAGMVKAAQLDAPDFTQLTATALYGCECSDGSSVTPACGTAPTCTYNVVNYVEVDTVLSYTPILPYPGIPSPIRLTGTSRLRSAH